MKILKSIWDNPYFFWVLISLPSIGMITKIFDPNARYGGLMHGTGEFSARFLVIALIISPLMFLSGGKGWARWLLRRRRYIGIAAFGYALLHTIVYLREERLAGALAEWTEMGILTGWLAFLIFVPLALSSNNWSVRRLGPSWKTLQRWVYASAAFTFLHWGLVGHWGPAFVHAAPVVALSLYRIARWRRKVSQRVDVPADGVSGTG